MKAFVYVTLFAFLAIQMPKNLVHSCSEDHTQESSSSSKNTLDHPDCDFCAIDLNKMEADLLYSCNLQTTYSFAFLIDYSKEALEKPFVYKVSRGPPIC